MTPELDVRCDADLFVDRCIASARPTGPDVYVGGAAVAFRLRSEPRSPTTSARGAVPEHPAPRNSDGRGFIWAVTTTGMPDPGAAAGAGRMARAHRDPRRVPRSDRAGARPRARTASATPSWSTATRCRRAAASVTRTPGRVRADVVPGDRDGTSCSPAPHRARQPSLPGRGLQRRAPTIPTRAASSPPTTAAPPTASTPSRSSCAAISTWTRTAT